MRRNNHDAQAPTMENALSGDDVVASCDDVVAPSDDIVA